MMRTHGEVLLWAPAFPGDRLEGRIEPIFSSLQVMALGTICLLVVSSVLAPARREGAAPHLTVCVHAFLAQRAHVERQGTDSYSCCHLCSREQFWELMASNLANKVDTAWC